MAQYGLSNPFIAKLGVEGTYTLGFQCGKAVKTGIVPKYATAKLYADNIVAEQVDEFVEAAVTLGVSTLPVVAQTVLFGHEVAETTEAITYNASDSSNYVGYGFVVKEMIDGATSFTATVLYKVKFTEAGAEYETKGDTIVFKTPSLSGVAVAPESGKWQQTQTFATYLLAETFIKTELDITA